MSGDEGLHLLVVRHLGRELQEQALTQVAGADSRRLQALHHSQAFLLGYRAKWAPGPGTQENGDYA